MSDSIDFEERESDRFDHALDCAGIASVPSPFLPKECKFNVGSYIHDATQIMFTGTFGHDVENQRAQQYEINITALNSKDETIVWANRNYSQTGFKVGARREKFPSSSNRRNKIKLYWPGKSRKVSKIYYENESFLQSFKSKLFPKPSDFRRRFG